MPIQGTIVLDSGAFLTDENETFLNDGKETFISEVGYFKPKLIIYDDNEMVKKIEPQKRKEGETFIHVRHMRKRGKEITDGVELSDCLIASLLRMRELYQGRSEKAPRTMDVLEGIDKSQYDCIFRFTTGKFRSSMVKERYFKELDPATNKEGKRRKFKRPIPHDIVVSFDLRNGEYLELVMTDENGDNEELVWSSLNQSTIKNRFDIEIIADNKTAMDYFCHAVKPKRKRKVLVPNQGEPPPHWRHDGGINE